jgi:hypothetical protein
MSGINGDKARFHRERKEKIARRLRTKALYAGLGKPAKTAPPASVAKTKVATS